MQLLLDFQNTCDNETIPSSSEIERWMRVAFEQSSFGQETVEVTVRVVDELESQQLNFEYRGKDSPTNVLSFPFEAPAQIECDLLGDLVICYSVVEREAQEQKKALNDHWAHMIIHGTFHLLGYDHIEDDDAEIMESLEVQTLAKLAISNPY